MIDILLISAAIVASPTIHKKMDLSELYPREVQWNSRFKIVQQECWYEFILPVRGPEIEEYDIPTTLHPVFGIIGTEPWLTETQEWKTAEQEYKDCMRAQFQEWTNEPIGQLYYYLISYLLDTNTMSAILA